MNKTLENYKKFRKHHEVEFSTDILSGVETACNNVFCVTCILREHDNCRISNLSNENIEEIKEIYPEDFI